MHSFTSNFRETYRTDLVNLTKVTHLLHKLLLDIVIVVSRHRLEIITRCGPIVLQQLTLEALSLKRKAPAVVDANSKTLVVCFAADISVRMSYKSGVFLHV